MEMTSGVALGLLFGSGLARAAKLAGMTMSASNAGLAKEAM